MTPYTYIGRCFAVSGDYMLANMGKRADTRPSNCCDLAVYGLPAATVPMLVADVKGSTRLRETKLHEMTAAVARLDRTLSHGAAAHDGVRPVEQGQGHSFAVAFTRARDAVACAFKLRRAALAPITDPDLVIVAAAQALGLADQPDPAAMNTPRPVYQQATPALGDRQLRTPPRCNRGADDRRGGPSGSVSIGDRRDETSCAADLALACHCRSLPA